MHASSAAIYRRALSAALIAAVLAMFSFSLAYAETGGRLPLLLLVRHADKSTGQADDNDPPLSPAGMKRAEELATALRESGVNAIITTELRRTRETAAPLAAILALTPEVIAVQSSGSRHIKALEKTVHRHTGEVVLVVGHANTIPDLIAALGGPKLPEICDAVYDNLFTVFAARGKVHFIRSRYGEPTPDTGPECQSR
jgi:broad specificity phosphatase PhoE